MFLFKTGIAGCALILLMSSFSFMALADSKNVHDRIKADDKISTALSSEISRASGNEKISVIVVLKNQTKSFNTIIGRSKIDNEQRNLIRLLNAAKSSNKVQKIKPIRVVNAIAVKATPEVIDSLVNSPEVLTIEPDNIVSIEEDQTLYLRGCLKIHISHLLKDLIRPSRLIIICIIAAYTNA